MLVSQLIEVDVDAVLFFGGGRLLLIFLAILLRFLSRPFFTILPLEVVKDVEAGKPVVLLRVYMLLPIFLLRSERAYVVGGGNDG